MFKEIHATFSRCFGIAATVSSRPQPQHGPDIQNHAFNHVWSAAANFMHLRPPTLVTFSFALMTCAASQSLTLRDPLHDDPRHFRLSYIRKHSTTTGTCHLSFHLLNALIATLHHAFCPHSSMTVVAILSTSHTSPMPNLAVCPPARLCTHPRVLHYA